MNKNIETIALSKKGHFTSLEYTKACKVKKGSPEIIKTTKVLNARIGCSYDALKTTREAKGVEVDKSEIEQYLQASEKRSGEMPSVMNIGVDDINYIH